MRSLVGPGLAPLLLVAGAWLFAAGLWADEATLPNGKRLQGELTLDKDGRLRFTANGRSVAMPEVESVRFAAASSPPPAERVYRVVLLRDQMLTGELLGLDEKSLRLGTTWAGPLTVPRYVLSEVSPAEGVATLVNEDFEGDLKAWKLTGAPALDEREKTSGRRSLRLDAPGQAAEYRLARPLEAGRLVVRFHDSGGTTGARWLVEARFEHPDGPRSYRFILAGPGDAFQVEGPGNVGEIVARKRAPGWHRFSLRFGADYLLAGIDDAVFWDSGKHGPGGPLTGVRLVCAELPADGKAKGEMRFDDFSLSRPVGETPRRGPVAGQDELVLGSGDQWFGRVVRADKAGVEFRARFGTRTLPWADVRAVRFSSEVPPGRATDGEHVRLSVRSGGGLQQDAVEGVVKALDGRRLVLQHAHLGELSIHRDHLRGLRGLFHGRRVEVDHAFHHLGREIVPTLAVPRPSGLSVRRSFRLDAGPGEVRLVVHAVQLKGPGDGEPVAKALAAGGGRTEVLLNGQVVDYLNRHVERSSPEPQRIRLVLPRNVLRAGTNALELRQTRDAQTGRYEDCGVFGLAVEVARP